MVAFSQDGREFFPVALTYPIFELRWKKNKRTNAIMFCSGGLF